MQRKKKYSFLRTGTQDHAISIRRLRSDLQDPQRDTDKSNEAYVQHSKILLQRKLQRDSPRKKRTKVHRGLVLPQDKLEQSKAKRMRLCGTKWQEEYRKLHEDILQSRKPRKFLVYLCGGEGYGCGGYGNRISAISSLLFLAVLTQRAFLIDWKYSISLETYLQPKNIRWNYSMANLEGLAMRRHYWGNGALTDADATIATSIKRTPSVFGAWLRKTDFREYFNYTVEVVTSMWYGGEHMSNNPYLAGHMKRLGTLDDSAKFSLIGCAFDFLFTKAPRLETRLTEMKESIGMKPNVPFIGFHIRMGDAAFGIPVERKGAVRTRDHQAFFTCASNFESAIMKANPNISRNEIKWFLASDDVNIKRFAIKTYGAEKVVTLDVKLEHSAVFRKKLHIPSDEGMMGVLLDNFILSECDYLVLSKSTFSNAAIGLSLHLERSYTHGEHCKFS